MPKGERRPITATYRLQLNRSFTFAAAADLVPYFAELGISHLYLSPITTARPGSAHGYDVVDPTTINPELGGADGFEALAARARAAGLGLVLDIVPNHMAADRRNATFMETLWLGRQAPSAAIYDIDWSRDRVGLPVLGGSLEDVLARGEVAIALNAAGGTFCATYFDHAAPLRPRSVAALLDAAVDGLPAARDVAAQWRALERFAGPAEVEAAREALRNLASESGDALAEASAQADLPTLLAEQHWRFDDWRRAASDLSYRRFFNIVELVGVRVEDPDVFDFVHALPLSLVDAGLVDGLRVDHVDGLADPAGYCAMLRRAVGEDTLLVVEKILEGGETLRPWPVDGTTGYERLNDITGLFIDARGAARLDNHLVAQGLLSGAPHERLVRAKRQVLEEMLASELERLVALAERDRPSGNGGSESEHTLRRAVIGLCIHCPVYRSYITQAARDRADEAVWADTLSAFAAEGDADASALARRLVDEMLAGQLSTFVTALQQLTGPIMAKGLEDTEFYRSVGLLAGNEVGADLASPAMSIARFHERSRAACGRRDLVPLATHDTKRGVDARARSAMLSADADGYIASVARWEAATARLLERAADGPAPDALDRWLILQTIVAAWPISAERLEGYTIKALREAKRRTRWEAPDEAYEAAAVAYGRSLLEAEGAAAARDDMEGLVAAIDGAARLASLAQTILQATLPGVPDIYQGCELWDHSLVDPDNRRPVDWDSRRLALTGSILPPIAQDGLGLSKLILLRRLLALRRAHPVFFAEATYEPIALADGPGRFVAFIRRAAGSSLLVAVPTRPTALHGPIALPGLLRGSWRNVVNDQTFEVRDAGTSVDRGFPFVVGFRHDAQV